MGPEEISNAVGGLFNSQVMQKFVVYVGWSILALLILGSFVVVYYLIQFKYKVTYPVILYDSDKNSAQILKFKKDRARIIKRKNGIRKTQFLFQRKITEPIRQEDVKPGNIINLLRINDDGTYTTLPSFRLDKVQRKVGTETKQYDEPVEFEYLTNEEKMWCVLELKETQQSNQLEDAQKRILTYTLIAIGLLGAIVIAGIWLTLKYTGGVTDALKGITPSLANIASGFSGSVPI